MSAPTPSAPSSSVEKAVADVPAAPLPAGLRDLSHLTKPRLSALVLLAVVCGFFMAGNGPLAWGVLGETLLGTALVAVAASMLNQFLERSTDAQMRRTADRPLPSGRMNAAGVLYAGALVGVAGLSFLALRVNLETAQWAALTFALYVFAYTPLKRRTTLNTLMGAVPGALPPLIGWAAVEGVVPLRAWTLFAILFIWQLPHFLAIAWLYRKDYAAAGHKMLPVADPDGSSTGRQMVLHCAALLPISLLPYFRFMAGPLYFVTAVVLGLVFFAFTVRFLVRRDDRAARQVFLASVAYLPLLLAVMMFDRL